MARKTQAWYDDVIAHLRQQPTVHADETSGWVGGPGHWLWTFTCPSGTVYHVDTSRGRNVVREMLGDDFAGVLVSDCLASDENLPYTMQKCDVHHFRAIAESRERAPPESHADFDELAGLLHAALWLKKLRPELPLEEAARRRVALDATADRLLTARTGPVAKVALRLQKRRR